MAAHVIYSFHITLQLFSIQCTAEGNAPGMQTRMNKLHKKVKTRTIVKSRVLEQLF